jgi:hypothetical protein
MPRPAPKRAGKSRQRLNALNAKDRIAGPASLALLVSFWLPWYSIGPFSADGLSVHGWLFIAVLNSIVLVLYVLITAFGAGDRAQQGRMSKDQLLGPHDRGQCRSRSAGLPAQADRIQLVVGRLSRAGRRHRGFSAVWRSPRSGSALALNRSSPEIHAVGPSQEPLMAGLGGVCPHAPGTGVPPCGTMGIPLRWPSQVLSAVHHSVSFTRTSLAPGRGRSPDCP